ncbi:MAG: type II toxin-antitoxin system PemK/MazF family toxin [Candidatus Dormibacteraeota bacterium]|nr:type II toxin-antitoxin system PemK/MazF family toxin [Candidatus Dormibacteraeota bacterium]
MTRGEIWTAAGGSAYAGKPRPVVVIQDDRFDATESVTICAFTTDPTEAPLFRLRVEPSKSSGLHEQSSVMVDKITTVHRSRLAKRVGHLADEDLVRLGRAIVVFLGLAGA